MSAFCCACTSQKDDLPTVGYAEVVPLKYDNVHSFSEGLAAVFLNNQRGYIDKNGREITPLKYDDAENFSEGMAVVSLDGKWGFIDKTGNEIISLKYVYAKSFSEGLGVVSLDGLLLCEVFALHYNYPQLLGKKKGAYGYLPHPYAPLRP